jgi:hypothetical protein
MSSTYRIPLFQRYAFAGPDLGRRDISGQAGDAARDPRLSSLADSSAWLPMSLPIGRTYAARRSCRTLGRIEALATWLLENYVSPDSWARAPNS